MSAEAPILLWIYEPHWAPAVFEGTYIEFPPYEAACYEDPAWGVNPDALYDCGKPEGWIKKMAWAGGEAIWPCAYDIVRNFHHERPRGRRAGLRGGRRAGAQGRRKGGDGDGRS